MAMHNSSEIVIRGIFWNFTEKRSFFQQGSKVVEFGIFIEKRKIFSNRFRGSEILGLFGIFAEKRKVFSTRIQGSGILEFLLKNGKFFNQVPR